MNKILVSCCFLLLSFQAFSLNNQEAAVAVFQTIKPDGKSLTKDIVLIHGGQIIVNGGMLSSSEALLKSPMIKNIMSVQASKKTSKCVLGSYTHTVKFGKTPEKLERGCVESIRYKEIKKLFRKVKRSVLLQ